VNVWTEPGLSQQTGQLIKEGIYYVPSCEEPIRKKNGEQCASGKATEVIWPMALNHHGYFEEKEGERGKGKTCKEVNAGKKVVAGVCQREN